MCLFFWSECICWECNRRMMDKCNLVFPHAGISGAGKFRIFCTIPDTLHDIHTSHMPKAVM